MKFKATNPSKLTTDTGSTIFQCEITGLDTRAFNMAELKDFGELSVEVKKYRNSRSVNANGYLWVLLYKIGAVINRAKEDVYLMMLRKYGIFTQIHANKNAVERIKAQWKTAEVLDEKQIEGTDITKVKMLCYFGSSTYNTQEFSVLLDGVINEAKDLGIETMEEQEKQAMMAKWEE